MTDIDLYAIRHWGIHLELVSIKRLLAILNCASLRTHLEIMASAAASSDVEATTTAGTATVIATGATPPKEDEKIEAFPLPAWV